MAIFKADFSGTKFEQVEGYRISTAFTPTQGFEGHFFIYLWDVVDAEMKYQSPLKVHENNEGRRGTLTISDGADVTYTFPEVNLIYTEVGATRSQRYRLAEFRYHQNVTDRETPPNIVLDNAVRRKLTVGGLKDEYDFKLNESPESLLGFRAHLSPNESNIVRFSTLRNDSNSFLKKIVDVNKSQVGDRMPSFTIDFKQQRFEVTQDNLMRAYVDESYGTFTELPLPSTEKILRQSGEATLARLRPTDFTPAELIDHDVQRMRERAVKGYAVETATFMFHPGEYRDTEIS